MRDFKCDKEKTDLLSDRNWFIRIWNETGVIALYEFPEFGGKPIFVKNFKTPYKAQVYAEEKLS